MLAPTLYAKPFPRTPLSYLSGIRVMGRGSAAVISFIWNSTYIFWLNIWCLWLNPPTIGISLLFCLRILWESSVVVYTYWLIYRGLVAPSSSSGCKALGRRITSGVVIIYCERIATVVGIFYSMVADSSGISSSLVTISQLSSNMRFLVRPNKFLLP